MDKLDQIYCKMTGTSLIKSLYDSNRNRSEVFDYILQTHPAIFMVEYSLAQTLIEMGIYPDYVLGASLGEYTACSVSGVMSCEDIMDCLVTQAKMLEEHAHKGSMLVVLGNPYMYQQIPVLYQNSELAAINYHSHFVLSGRTEGIEEIQKYLNNKDVVFYKLPVLFGFHSSSIDNIASSYLDYLRPKSYKHPKINLISCMSGGRVASFQKEFLWDFVRKPIDFPSAIKYIGREKECVYIDVGPSGTMANFVKYNLESANEESVFSIITPFGDDAQNVKKLYERFSSKKQINYERKERNMKAYIFPGQGSQAKGMGGELFDEFKELTKKVDGILGYSIKQLCLEDPDNKLGKTEFTQPAIYVVNAFSYLKKIKETGVKPDYVAGHSLGEYNALFASGVFDIETGLRLVKRRGELMSQARGGGMAAVLGLKDAAVREVIVRNGLNDLDVANYNSPKQIVISGPKESIEAAQQIFESAGAISYIVLKVSGAFHSRYMEVARKNLEEYFENIQLSKMEIPVISNVYARPYKQKELKSTLLDQMTHSVQWTDTIRYMMGKGVDEISEIGHGNVLGGLLRKILAEAQPLIVEEEETSQEDEVEEIELKNTEVEIEKTGTSVICQNTGAEGTGATAETLGNSEFRKDYGLKYAYAIGGMYNGIASKELVVKAAKAGMLSFFGAGGLGVAQLEEALQYIQQHLGNGQAYGINFVYSASNAQKEEKAVDLLIKYAVRNMEASGYISVTPALVRYKLKGLSKDRSGNIISKNKIIAKISRPEVAEVFLSPAPQPIVQKLLEQNMITQEEANMAMEVPLADDLCAEADSGGHTDHRAAYVLIPSMLRLRDTMMKKYKYRKNVRVGAAGGIGTPEAALAAFALGADFIVTGSINQCTVEAGTSDAVKDLLQQMNVQDTEYVPAGDMFEMGTKAQVLKRGVFFPARANRLHELYRQYNSIDEIDEKTQQQIQEKYFRKSFGGVFEEIKKTHPPEEINKAENNSKYKMALIFKWYFDYSAKLALHGDKTNRVDYQIHCGSSLGAFNQWVKGTELENWSNRHVDDVGIRLMNETADLINKRFKLFLGA